MKLSRLIGLLPLLLSSVALAQTPPPPAEEGPPAEEPPLDLAPPPVLAVPAEAARLPVAEAPTPAVGTVRRVEVTGIHRVEEAAILASVGLRPGEELLDWKVDRDIKAVYRSGFVDDIRVDVSKADESGGVVVTFQVVEKPAIREWKTSGNKKLDDDALKEVIDLNPFAVLNESDLKRNVGAIRAKYIEKGYYLVEVEPVVRPVSADLVELDFKITENRKVTVQRIDITGNDNLPDRKVRRFLQTKQGGIAPWLTSAGSFDEDVLEVDVQTVRQVFMEEGYVDVKVDAPKVYLSPDKRFIFISINVQEGPRYKLGGIKVEGDFVEPEGLTRAAADRVVDGDTARVVHERWEKARKRTDKANPDNPEAPLPEGWEKGSKVPLRFDPTHPPMHTGDWFKLSTFQLAMGELSKLYGDQGYAYVNVSPITDTDPEAAVVDVTFQIDRGEKVRIGRIDISGNDPTYDKVIRREIPINEGEIYSGSKIEEGRSRLDRLGYFEEVRISTPRGATQDEMDMKVEVTEQPTGSFSVGAGFSNLETFVFTANVSKNNFLGLGYVMSAAVNVSRARQQGNLQLYDPYFLDSRWTLRVDGFSIARQYIEDEYQRGGSIGLGRYLDKRDDIRMEVEYTFEDTGITNILPYQQKLLGGQLYRNGFTSTGGLSLVVDKRNNRIQATRGIYATASAALSGGVRVNDSKRLSIFGGDFNFSEIKLNFRAYQPLVKKEWMIFKFNSSMGWLKSTDGSIVPWIHRYRAGGIQSVRGYDWYSLGPSIRATGYRASERSNFTGSDDPTAADDRLVVGGTETWINNFEIDMPVIRQAGISFVTFFDAGNAFGDPWGTGHISPLKLRTAYGFGVRWISPMGPLRFEWGFPINPRVDERKSVFDFSIGSLF